MLWLVEEGSSENLYLTYVSFMPGFNYLNFVNIPFKWLYGTVIEPNGVSDRYGNHILELLMVFKYRKQEPYVFKYKRQSNCITIRVIRKLSVLY